MEFIVASGLYRIERLENILIIPNSFFLFIVCDCYEEGTENGNKCNQDNGYCTCKDGWHGYKCLFSKSIIMSKSSSSKSMHL